MKFRFNGEANCPDWILNEINTLSRLSSVKLKILGQIVCKGIINPPIKMEDVDKLFADSKLDTDISLKSSIACINYLISSAIQFNCDSQHLHYELQQLGLPREHSNAIKKVFDEYYSKLYEKAHAQSLKINPLKEVSGIEDVENGFYKLKLKIGEKDTEEIRVLQGEVVEDLLNDLIKVREIMLQLKV